MNSKKKGRYFEDLAEIYLKKNGYQILNRNFHSRYGEIDIIAKDNDNNLVFFEVKGRTNLKFGFGEESITKSKIKKLVKTAEIFLNRFSDLDFNNVRFDVITFYKGKIKHIKNIIEID